jgi:hypothetical protein
VRPLRLSFMLEIAILLLLPSSAWSDNLGATRIPEAARSASTAPADPGGLDFESGTAQPEPGAKPTSSKTLNSGAKDPGERRIENTMEGLTAPGSLFGSDTNGAMTDGKERTATGQVPELHVVQKGDTLWSLCSKYFNDPWRWPRLWAANPSITNPHWIFPGDVIRLGDGSAPAACIHFTQTSNTCWSDLRESSGCDGRQRHSASRVGFS